MNAQGNGAKDVVFGVTFALIEDDLVAFVRANQHRTWLRWSIEQLVVLYSLLPFIFLVLVYNLVMLRTRAPITPLQIFLTISMVFLIIVMWRGMKNHPRRLVRIMLRLGQNNLQLFEQTFTISAEGVEWRGLGGHRFYRWFAILRLQRTTDHAFIYTDLAHGFIVPARAFASSPQFETFVTTAKNYLASAQAYGLVCPRCQYDLRGEIEPGCPECGWRRDDIADSSVA